MSGRPLQRLKRHPLLVSIGDHLLLVFNIHLCRFCVIIDSCLCEQRGCVPVRVCHRGFSCCFLGRVVAETRRCLLEGEVCLSLERLVHMRLGSLLVLERDYV